MGCCGRGGANRTVTGKTVVGYRITFRDGSTEDVASTDLAVVRRKVTLGGGGTYKAITK